MWYVEFFQVLSRIPPSSCNHQLSESFRGKSHCKAAFPEGCCLQEAEHAHQPQVLLPAQVSPLPASRCSPLLAAVPFPRSCLPHASKVTVYEIWLKTKEKHNSYKITPRASLLWPTIVTTGYLHPTLSFLELLNCSPCPAVTAKTASLLLLPFFPVA